MLVLTRRPGEGLHIGDDIKITILEIKGGGIRIGIDAPRDKRIYRHEIYDRICQENQEATNWDIDDLNMLTKAIKEKKKP